MQTDYYAKLKWKDEIPSSSLFDDVYSSVASASGESEYVFIDGNELEQRFLLLRDNDVFIIGETGFGSGRNFLKVMEVWQKLVTTKAKLFFISFEKYPLHPTDLKKININLINSKELEDEYYLILPATHRFSFKNNVFLNLVIGDIRETIPQQNFTADCWFLDGFTPKRNPEMWKELVFSHIARLSKPGATFATYTANSSVRKKLENSGFLVEKHKGFNKREMLCGSANGQLKPPKISRPKPWFAKPLAKQYTKIIIIGGGISGASTAYSLAKRGYKVTLYEQSSRLAPAASGNYQAILYGNFAGTHTPIIELSYSGYRYSHYLTTQFLNEKSEEYQKCGLIQLYDNSEELPGFLTYLPTDFCQRIDKQAIEKLAGVKVKHDYGIYFPHGLWLNPELLVKKLTDLPNITICCDHKIDDVSYIDNKWQLLQKGKIIDNSEALVLCNADSANQFTVTRELHLRKIRGQISIINQDTHSSNLSKFKSVQPPRVILCGRGYITPPRHNNFTVGATFDFKNLHTNISSKDHLENLLAINSISDNWQEVSPSSLKGHAAIRASTFDYMPLVGPLAIYNQFVRDYAKLSHDKNAWIEKTCAYHPGLYLNVGHGAKGMLTAPICGEIIADYIDNTPAPGSKKLLHALHPNRVYLRQLVKNCPPAI